MNDSTATEQSVRTVAAFKPLYDRLVVLPEQDELARRAEEAGLTLPAMVARPKPQEGLVMAIGPGWTDHQGTRREVPVAPGTKVLFPPHAGHEVEIDGKQYLILNSGDLLGYVEEEGVPATA